MPHLAAMQQTDTLPAGEKTAEKTVIEAIATQRLISARYNGAEMALAPHLLFARHGDLFISALNPAKNWRSDEEPRLGHFKLAGLSEITLRDEEFTPLPSFDGSAPRDDDQSLFAVELPEA